MLRLEAVGLAEVDAAGSSRRSRGQTRRKWLWIGPALSRVRWGEATNGEFLELVVIMGIRLFNYNKALRWLEMVLMQCDLNPVLC